MHLDALRPFWHPVAYARDIGDGPHAAKLLDEPLVLFRSGDVIACFKDLCIHRGTALSRGTVEGGCLVCAYHHWTYDASGQCVRIPQQPPEAPIPKKARVLSFRCKQQYGLVWVALDEPIAEIGDFPEWDDPNYRHVPTGPYLWRTSAPRMLENFTDFGHFAFVHAGLLGDPSRPLVPPYHVERVGNELRYEIDLPSPVVADDRMKITQSSDQEFLELRGTYRLTMPLTIHLSALDPQSGGDRMFFFAVQPISDKESCGYPIQGRNFGFDTPDSDYTDFQDIIQSQDQAVVETQRPEELPVDLSAELHLPFDRVAVNYRRWLAELGVEAQPGTELRTG